MDIQNISGPDMISGAMNANTRISTENVKTEKPEPQERIPNPENEKGNYIDTKA